MNTPRRLLEPGHCVVDLDRGEVRRDDAATPLTVRECELLAYLVAHRDEAVSRDALLAQVWGYSPKVLTRAVDMSVRRLRGKVEADPARPSVVQTVHGEGYRYTGPPASIAMEPRPRRPVGPLFGRQQELAAIRRALVEATGPVMVVGPPGVGKTRLAREVHEDWEDEALFCDLRGVTTLEGLIAAVSAALEADLSPSAETHRAVAELAQAMAGTGLLLVLDNFEQLAPVAAQAPAAWARDSHVLVTSRVALGVEGEQQVALKPLAEEDAVALFLHHAAGRVPGLGTGAEAKVVVDLVHALDRLPLALVLTAARAGVLPVSAMVRRFRERMDVTGGAMEAAIAESWTLVEHDLRRALAACTVFRGGFPVEAAEHVLGGPDPLAWLEALRERSLVEVERSAEGYRFALLDAVRTFAAGHRETLDPAGLAERRHAQWCVRFGQAVLARHRHGAGEGLSELARERENLVAAFERFETREPALAVRAALGLMPVFSTRGPMDAAATLLRRVVRAATATGDPSLEAECRVGLGRILRAAGATDSALRELTAARELARDDPRLEVDAIDCIAALHMACSRYHRAIAAYEEALPLLRALGASEEVGAVQVYMGRAYDLLGDNDTGMRLVRSGIATLERSGATRTVASAMSTAAPVLRAGGEHAEALAVNERALALHRELGNDRLAAVVLVNLANQKALAGDLEAARLDYGRALEIYRHVGVRAGEGLALANLARLELLRGDLRAALDTAREALHINHAAGNVRVESGARLTLGLTCHLDGDLTEARLHMEAAVAGFRVIGSHREAAHALAFLAAVRAESHDSERAAEAIEAARAELSEGEHREDRASVDLLAAAIAGSPVAAPPDTFEGAMAARVAARF